MARNAAKLAVPPPINRYGTSFGISADFAGIFAIEIHWDGLKYFNQIWNSDQS